MRDVSDINLFTLTNGIFCCSGCLYDKIFSLLSVNGDLKFEDFGRNLTLLTFKVSSFSDSFLYGIKALKVGGFFSSNSESSLWGLIGLNRSYESDSASGVNMKSFLT